MIYALAWSNLIVAIVCYFCIERWVHWRSQWKEARTMNIILMETLNERMNR